MQVYKSWIPLVKVVAPYYISGSCRIRAKLYSHFGVGKRHISMTIFRSKILRANSEKVSQSEPTLQDFIQSSGRKVEPKTELEEAENHPYVDKCELHGKNRSVYIKTYGCQMNVSDTEVIWAVLKSAGFCRTENEKLADVILIVTCAIREGAEQKIWNLLENLRALKKKRRHGIPLKIGVLGCMAERLKTKLLEKEKIVDIVAGPDSYRDLPRLLALANSGETAVNILLSLEETYADIVPVRINPESKTAFVSIMRGCDNMCSYCIVPFTRGRERSRPVASILDEVRSLSDQGVKETILLGQNVNSYRDMSETSHVVSDSFVTRQSQGFHTVYKPKCGGLRFVDLLERVSSIDPEMRIRFTSPHPKDFPDEVLEIIRDQPNICNQLHLPAQSGNTEVLERMRRGYTREAYLNLVMKVREFIPDVALTSDFISGFCGETDAAHQDTISLLKLVQYNYIFAFPYSMREKTRAYHRLSDDVPEETKHARTKEVLQTFREIVFNQNRRQIGKEQLILVEGLSKRSELDMVGRNDGNTKVIFSRKPIPNTLHSEELASVSPGDYIVVKINDCSSQVLKGEPLYQTTLQEFNSKQNAQRQFVESRQ